MLSIYSHTHCKLSVLVVQFAILIFIQVSGPQTDVAAPPRGYQMPMPQELLNKTQSSSWPASMVSRSSSLATVSVASTVSNSSHNKISRMMDQGLNQEYHIVHRRPQHQLDLPTASSDGVAPQTKENVQAASKKFLAKLANKHCWPAGAICEGVNGKGGTLTSKCQCSNKR